MDSSSTIYAGFVLPGFLNGVNVECSAVPTTLEGVVSKGVLWQAGNDSLLLDVPGVARYLTQGDRSLTIEPAPGADFRAIGFFMKTTPFAALVYQRNMAAFHASACVGPRHAVVIAGDSGVGKTALLGALMARGWKMLSDELSVVEIDGDGAARVLPVFPEIHPWSYASERAQRDACKSWQRCVDASVNGSFAAEGARLGCFLRLSVHNKDEVVSSAVDGISRFELAGSCLYNTRVAKALLDGSACMRIASVMCAQARMLKVSRPNGRDSVEALADLVEAVPN